MGINTVSANNQQNFNGVAGAAITAGDLVVNSEAGVIYPASPSLTFAQNNNTTAGPTAISALATVISGTYGNTQQLSSSVMAQLGNGSIVSLYNGDGTTGETNLNVYTRNVQGAGVVNTFSISDSSITSFRVKAVNANSYVVAWLASSTLKFRVYTNAGVVVKSTTTVSATSASNQKNWDVQTLINGNIVFAWYNTSGGLTYAIYDSTGTAVLAATVSEASSQPQNIIIVKQTGGGFFLYYNNVAGTAYKFSRYNASGTLQGTLTTVASGASSTFNGCVDDNLAIELTNGNVVFGACNGSGYPFYYVYSSTGTVVASAIDVSNSTSTISFPGIIPGMCATPTGFAIVTPSNGGSRYFNIFDTSGTFIVQRKQTTFSTLNSFTNSTASPYQRAFSNGNAGLTVHEQIYYNSGCSAFYRVQLYSFDSNGVQRGSLVVLQADTGTQSTNLFGISLSDGSVVVTHRWAGGGTSTSWGSYAVIRKSILGVAQNTASANSTTTVLPSGNFNINQTMGFGGAFDNRSATVPGTRGTVVGTSVVLFGLS